VTIERWTDDRIDQVVSILETNTQVIAQLAQGQQKLTDVIERLSNAQVGLAEAQSKLTHVVERMEARLTSTSAAVERLERVVDYLLRADENINNLGGLDRKDV
jgi:DNA repair ATPase RecN